MVRRWLAFGLLVLGALSFFGSDLRAQEDQIQEEEAAREAAKPTLLFATDDAFVHFVRPEPASFEMRRWDIERYGDLLLTQRDDGSMVRLLSARLEAIPTRRQKFFELRIAGVGRVGDRLVAVAWHTTSWDRPPREIEKERTAAGYEAEPTLARFKTLYVFSLEDGSAIGQRPLTDIDCSKLKQLPDLLPVESPVVLDAEQAACFLKLLDAEQEEPATP